MSYFINREALLHAFGTSPIDEWATWAGQFASEGSELDHSLYYLSMDANLEGEHTILESFDDLFAKAQDSFGKQIYTVALPPRLICGTDLQSCWNQIFPRIKMVYEDAVDFSSPIKIHLYEVDLSNCVVIKPKSLVDERLLHHAHLCDAHAVFGHPVFKLKESFEIKNTLNYPDENRTYYNPFNDDWYAEQLLCTPLEILNSKKY